MTIRTILQVRTRSQRLPCKAMLMVGGMPLAVLCGKRLRGPWDGAGLRVVTSTDPSDDLLALTLASASLPVLRGPLDDVRARFVAATADMAPEDVVIRCTADNAFPDWRFVRHKVEVFEAERLTYMGVGNGTCADGLPYGVACEIFRVRDLRREPTDARDAEHVTYSIRARSAPRTPPAHHNDLSQLRATVDTADDYLRVAQVFHGVPDPVTINTGQLIDRLLAISPPSQRVRPLIKRDRRPRAQVS